MLDSIPKELILEILSRLSAKSVARFCCVSKLWAFIFGGPCFTELFLTRSSARPRLLFGLRRQCVELLLVASASEFVVGASNN
ncbi:putative F-box protein [Cardamine amara subsp. amara]|uniref:F-box protein n=1 Tax=Cardamine amara subsp. amara TaxID=228776 RepID=A0ABD0ZQS1_CARAN